MKNDNLYKNLSKENFVSMIFHLYSRHDQAASSYQQIVTDLKENSTLSNWFSSLSELRKKFAEALRPFVENNSTTPAKPSEEMKSYFHDKREDIIEFINQNNEVGLIELSLEAEEDMAKYYQKVEANEEIPEDIREKLNQQHDQLIDVIQKAQRLQTVPEQDRQGFAV